MLDFIYKMFGLISKKRLISMFAEELANKQKRADYWYYVKDNQDMSNHVLNHVDGIKDLAKRLGIVGEVYEKAYAIYDFRNSGKKDFAPNLDELSKLT